MSSAVAARRLAATVQHLAPTNTIHASGAVGPSIPNRTHTAGSSTSGLDITSAPLKIVNLTIFGAGLMGLVVFRRENRPH